MRLDSLGQLFTLSLAFYLVYGGVPVDPSTIGFLLNMAGTLCARMSLSNSILTVHPKSPSAN